MGGTEVLILFPVEVRDIGEIEIKDTYFQKENLLHIYIYIYFFFFYYFRASHKLLTTPEFGVDFTCESLIGFP